MTATDPNPSPNPGLTPGSNPGPTLEADLETVLRRELALRAQALGARPPGAVPYAAVARAVRRDRRRRQTGAAATLALAFALAVAIPANLTGLAKGGPAVAPPPLLAIATRGNLAGDAGLLAAAVRRLNEGGHPVAVGVAPEPIDPGPGEPGFKILYAQDDGTLRIIVGADYEQGQTYVEYLVGNHGSAVSALVQESSPGPVGPLIVVLIPWGLAGASSDSPAAFVVLGPTDLSGVEYSVDPDPTADGGRAGDRAGGGIVRADTVNGAASGEAGAAPATITAVRAELGGQVLLVPA